MPAPPRGRPAAPAGEPDWSRYRPVGEILAGHARSRPDSPFLVSIDQDGRSLSFGGLWRLSNRIARYLAARGVGAGGRVAVLAPNSLETLALYFGIQAYGAAFCTMDAEVNASHADEMLRRMEPELVLWRRDGGLARPGGDAVPFGDLRPGRRARDGGLFEELDGLSDAPGAPSAGAGPDDLCVMSFTSGTAAAPKGVLHTFGNYFWIADQTIDMWGLAASDRMLEFRSVAWASSHMLCLQPALVVGATVLLARRFSRSRFFDWLRRWRPTMVVGVPTVVNMLLEHEPDAADREATGGLRFMSSSTAPLMVESHRRFEDVYGVELVQLYGMSEGGVVAGNHVGGRRIGSVGRPGLYQNLRIVDAGGRELPAGETGEIEIGGAQTAWGYLHPGGATERIRGTRMRTGDIGHLDRDGFLVVSGRARDVIIRGGVNVAPSEVDGALAALPGLREAATVGVADPVYGEEIASFVALAPGSGLGPGDIRAWCAERLPAFKVPRHVVVLDEIPKNDRGKVDRGALSDLWAGRR